jgi:hypothetical protein
VLEIAGKLLWYSGQLATGGACESIQSAEATQLHVNLSLTHLTCTSASTSSACQYASISTLW